MLTPTDTYRLIALYGDPVVLGEGDTIAAMMEDTIGKDVHAHTATLVVPGEDPTFTLARTRRDLREALQA